MADPDKPDAAWPEGSCEHGYLVCSICAARTDRSREPYTPTPDAAPEWAHQAAIAQSRHFASCNECEWNAEEPMVVSCPKAAALIVAAFDVQAGKLRQGWRSRMGLSVESDVSKALERAEAAESALRQAEEANTVNIEALPLTRSA